MQVFPLSYLLLFSFIAAENAQRHRTKRKVVFSKSSKFFFRLNGKDNMLNYTDIFAHGWTIRVNYDLPETIPKRHQFFKRDIHTELEGVTNTNIKIAYSCILKYICEKVALIKMDQEECGMICGIGKIISSSTTMEAQFFKSFINNCNNHFEHCPYTFMDGFG